MSDNSWFGKMVAKSKRHDLSDFDSIVKSLHQEAQAIKYDSFDATKYSDMYDQSAELANVAIERKFDHPTWPPIVQDAFIALWKARPVLRDVTDMRPSHILNQMTIEKVLTVQEYEELRTWTKLDDWASAMGAVSLAEKLKKFYDEHEDLVEQQQALAELEQQLMEALKDLQQAFEGMTPGQIDDVLDGLADMATELDAETASLMGSSLAAQGDLRQAVQEGISEALGGSEQTMELVAGFGTDPGQWQRMDPRQRIALAKRMDKSQILKQVAKMVGRIKRLAVGQWRQRIVHGVDEIYDVGIGGDLENVLPSQFLYLADPETEDIFYIKYLEGSLLSYELRGTEKTAQGPIIVAMDNSGSMGGEREVWAKATGLALLQIAKESKRDFYGIHFSAGGWQGRPGSMKEWYFPKGEVDLEEVLDYAEHFFNGGTDFEMPLNRSIEIMREHFVEGGESKADIIMITDGECAVSPEFTSAFTEAKKELGFRMFGILIGFHSKVLASLSEETYTTRDLTKGDELNDMFTHL